MSTRVRANGIELAYEEHGEGEPLVLIAGIGAQLVHWPAGFCQRLADHGFRVIRFDNRDVGRSERIEGSALAPLPRLILRGLLGLEVEAPYTFADMADDTAGLLDALGIERAHIVGASMGGMIAQTLAIAHPQRLRSLTSIMSHTGERLHALARPRAIRALLQPGPRDRSEAMERALAYARVVSGTGFALDEAGIRTRAGQAYDRGIDAEGFMRQLAALCASPSRTAALAELRVPAAVIHGSEDPLVRPVGGHATARAIPGARLQLIEGMGHSLPPGTWEPICTTIVSLRAGQ